MLNHLYPHYQIIVSSSALKFAYVKYRELREKKARKTLATNLEQGIKMKKVSSSGKTIIKKLEMLVKEYFFKKESEEEFIPGQTPIPLNVPTYGAEEIIEVLDSLLSTQVTMGKKVRKFERLFSHYLGVKDGLMVNSGSTANLVALSVLSSKKLENHIKPREEVIVPAVTWSTSIFPIIDVGAKPVLVDVDMETFSLKAENIKEAISNKTKAIMPVHLLGNPCPMDEVMEIAQKHDLFVIEDCCEAHGAEFKSRKVGTFGDLGTYSFFFSHHISTIEGGMIVSNSHELLELAKPIRAHGWIRELDEKKKIADMYPHIDERYLFIQKGFNVRPTEVQGAFGIHQVKKLEDFIKIRRKNAEYFSKELEKMNDYFYLQEEQKNGRHVWFGYPIVIKEQAPFSCSEIRNYLESKNIESRPIMGGDMAEQPCMKHYNHRTVGNLENSRFIMRNGFFFGNNHKIRGPQREYIVSVLEEFINKHSN